jgi:signal transduction histidine kinase
LDVTVQVQGDPQEIPLEVKTALFRIAQEALTNIVKHAGAEEAKVVLIFDPDKVSIVVEDNGRGFDPNRMAMANRSAWGLLGMRERASLLGGTFYLDSQPRGGTRVHVEMPYRTEEESADGNEITFSG